VGTNLSEEDIASIFRAEVRYNPKHRHELKESRENKRRERENKNKKERKKKDTRKEIK
jgi:hypothetical protein